MGVSSSKKSDSSNPERSGAAASPPTVVELPPGRSMPPILPPPEGENCPFFDLSNDDIYEMILERLSTRDLVALMRTSRRAKATVDSFVRHSVYKGDRITRLRHFLANNPLTMSELVMKRRLDKLHSAMGDEFVSVIHLRGVRAMSEQYGVGSVIRREHVFNADDFPHLGNPSYIVREFKDEINREVVVLRSVCWLHFVKYFDNVPKGKVKCYD